MNETNTSYFPTTYQVPEKSSGYYKFQDGENRFRILSTPILGWEAWEDTNDGGRRPVRRRMDKPFETSEVDDIESVKHFQAFVVWNLDQEKIQILEITQKGLQKSLSALARSKAWGDPRRYNIVVTRSGQKLETKYELQPEPPTALDEGITQLYKDSKINLEALFDGGDPFAATEEKAATSLADDAAAELG